MEDSWKEYEQINQLYDECLVYLRKVNTKINGEEDGEEVWLIDNDEEQSYEAYNKDVKDFRHDIITETIFEEPDYETLKGKASYGKIKESGDKNDQDRVGNITETKNKTEVKNYESVDSTHPELDSEDRKEDTEHDSDPGYECKNHNKTRNDHKEANVSFKFENEVQLLGSAASLPADLKSERLRRLSEQLPKIIITQSNTSLSLQNNEKSKSQQWRGSSDFVKRNRKLSMRITSPFIRGYQNYPKRLVSKAGMENVALISNVPYEKIRLLNDTFHTLINLRWRWIVMGTVVIHFSIWLIFAVFWYITALAHYDFEPNPPKKTCVTGGKDFVTIFLASVEAQTTIGFGDRAIDEECPETIFLFIMQLILGTGLSGVLTCVVYAKLTRPEKLSRDGVGFSKNAVISLRDGKLCLMMRAWDLNYDHIINSMFAAHFISTHRTKEGETIRFFAEALTLQQNLFLLWPVTLVHVINEDSPLYGFTPEQITDTNYEITLTLKGASASMGTLTQSQTSYLPHEVVWGYRFLPVVKYDSRKQKYVIAHKKLDAIEPVDTPYCSASELDSTPRDKSDSIQPETPSSFSEKISAFHLEKTSSFKRKALKI